MKLPRRRFLRLASGAAALPTAARLASAQTYPQRPVKIIVSNIPGGLGFDLVARAVAEKLSAKLKQTFIVENRPGAAGNIGAEAVARSAPDGHTLLVALGSTFTINPSLYRKLPFDPQKDFKFIAIMVTTSNMLVVHPSLPVKSVAELIVFAKAAAAKKQPIAYPSGGNGTPGHLLMENFRQQAGFEAIHVPYRGNPQLVIDLVAGQVKVGFVATTGVVQHVREGRLRGLAISTRTRSPLAPDMLTIAEAGYPELEFESYTLLAAPAGIPGPVGELLEREVLQVLASPELQEKFRAQDTMITPMNAAQARARIEADAQIWAKVVKATGMRID